MLQIDKLPVIHIPQAELDELWEYSISWPVEINLDTRWKRKGWLEQTMLWIVCKYIEAETGLIKISYRRAVIQ